jgi:MFS family permease
MAPALSTIALELDMNSAESVMALSIYLLATAFGPLLIGPLSEIYGRAPILHASNVWFLVWNIVCGFAKTKETLIAARFMAGFGASAIYALAGGVLGDIWRPEQRGKSLGVYLLIPLLGAAVGEIAMIYVFLSTLLMLTVCRPDHRWIHGCTHDLAMVSWVARLVYERREADRLVLQDVLVHISLPGSHDCCLVLRIPRDLSASCSSPASGEETLRNRRYEIRHRQ